MEMKTVNAMAGQQGFELIAMPQEGIQKAKSLKWSNLSFSVTGGTSGKPTTSNILKGLHGSLPSGSVTAIIGPVEVASLAF